MQQGFVSIILLVILHAESVVSITRFPFLEGNEVAIQNEIEQKGALCNSRFT